MFMPEIGNLKVELPPVGSSNARIAIVGDLTDGFEIKARRPFSGPAGQVLEQCLHTAGLIRGEVYTTNLIKEQSVGKVEKYYNEKKGIFTELGMKYVFMLKAELEDLQPNIIIAAGQAALTALCSVNKLSAYRGYLFPSTLCPGMKVIPTHH